MLTVNLIFIYYFLHFKQKVTVLYSIISIALYNNINLMFKTLVVITIMG